MRFVVLSLLPIIFLASSAFAQDLPTRGNLPKNGKVDIFKSTPEHIEEALQLTTQCKGAEYLSTYYDCDCLGMKFLELRQQRGDETPQPLLITEAQKSCPNAPEAAGETYDQCLVWAQAMRPRDYKDFCACFASEFGKLYEKKPVDSQIIREAQLTKAYSTCDKGKLLNERIERDSILKRIKEKGLYGVLFPGGVGQE